MSSISQASEWVDVGSATNSTNAPEQSSDISIDTFQSVSVPCVLNLIILLSQLVVYGCLISFRRVSLGGFLLLCCTTPCGVARAGGLRRPGGECEKSTTQTSTGQ
ncbi:unnamed protein product [Prorocentrum cordatum]|uniref:Uncharacterized protein n=1 Tax=Prorocentrum cordatum TaxID=2364126 RepID=A0ABN9UT21_9DINO|nr:unnamed protein product [Polarella glacialis]